MNTFLLMLIPKIDPNQLVLILGILFGFNTGWSFSDFDEWITSKFPEDFKNTFTFYLISHLLRAIHHYMIGIVIMVLTYPPSGSISLFLFGFGLGLFIEELDVFYSDLKKIKEKVKVHE